MSYQRKTLGRITRFFILIVVILATELGYSVGLYLATAVWLYMPQVVSLEESILEYITKVQEGHSS